MTEQLKPVYMDVFGKKVADTKAYIANGNLLYITIDGRFAINSLAQAKQFFAEIDYEEIGLSASGFMYNNTIELGAVTESIKKGVYGVTVYLIDKPRFAKSKIPLYGWQNQLIRLAA